MIPSKLEGADHRLSPPMFAQARTFCSRRSSTGFAPAPGRLSPPPSETDDQSA